MEGSDGQTEVIPAKAPAMSRVGVSNVLLPLLVKSWGEKQGEIELQPDQSDHNQATRTFLSCS